MGALLWRELVLVYRTGAFWAATAIYVSVLALFLLAWGDGFPVPTWGTNWQQFNFIQRVVLLLVLPWTAARCAATSNRDLIVFATAAGHPPSRILVAKSLALAISLFGLALSALPIALVMQEMAARPLMAVGTDMLPVLGMAMFVAAVTPACMFGSDNPLLGWIAATAATIVAASVIPESDIAMPMWIGVAVAAATPSLLVVDWKLRYLPETSP
jgi:hypothetical protein